MSFHGNTLRAGVTLDDLIALQKERALGDSHLFATDECGFHLAHTDAERGAGLDLSRCEHHRWLEGLSRGPVEPGIYVMVRRHPDAVDPFEFWPLGDES